MCGLVSVVVGKVIGFQQQLTDTLSDSHVTVTLPVQTNYIDLPTACENAMLSNNRCCFPIP